MNEPKQHHYIPKRYLTNFCDRDTPKRIFVFEKGAEKVFPSNIERIARERGFYLPEVEAVLANRVEGPANTILSRILKGQSISPQEKALLALYIAFLVKRVPAYRKKIDSIMTETSRQEMARIQCEIDEHIGDPDLRGRRQREVEELQIEWREGLPEDVRHYIQQPWMTEGIPAAIFAMAWHYFQAKEASSFATCDNPVFWFESLGLGNEFSELSLPLSSRVCLIATKAAMKDQQRVDAAERVVKEINRRTVTNASRYIYFHADVNWMRKMAVHGNYPDLRRIYKVHSAG